MGAPPSAGPQNLVASWGVTLCLPWGAGFAARLREAGSVDLKHLIPSFRKRCGHSAFVTCLLIFVFFCDLCRRHLRQSINKEILIWKLVALCTAIFIYGKHFRVCFLDIYSPYW